MSLHIVEERQRSRCPPAAAPSSDFPVMIQLGTKMPNYSCASPKDRALPALPLLELFQSGPGILLRQVPAQLVYHSSDPFHLRIIDLLRAVARGVVVRMETGMKPQPRHTPLQERP